MKTCPTCQTTAPDDERVCPSCGSPYPIASIREDARVVQLRERRERKEREEARRFWQQQRRQNKARRPASPVWDYWAASPATIVLMALTLVLSLTAFGFTGLLSMGGPLEIVVLLFVNPGFIGLLFSLFFLYFVGGELERAAPLALYLIVFFGSGLIGDLVEMQIGLVPVGLGPSLWGMVGGLYMWERLRGGGRYPLQWLTSTILITLVLNIFMLGFNIGQLLAQIVLALAIGAGIVWVWVQIPGTRRLR